MTAGDLLRSDETRYGLIYGIARLVDANPHHYGQEDPLFCVVNDSNEVSAMTWRTPPHRVGLAWHAGDPEEAVSLSVKALHRRWAEIPGVTGYREIAKLLLIRLTGAWPTLFLKFGCDRIISINGDIGGGGIGIGDILSIPGPCLKLVTIIRRSHQFNDCAGVVSKNILSGAGYGTSRGTRDRQSISPRTITGCNP